MTWDDIREASIACADAVASLTNDLGSDELQLPALGEWDVRGLAGHLLRAIRLPVRYLREPEPVGEPLPTAAAYFAAYLDWRGDDPETADSRVATRGSAELARASPAEVAVAFEAAARELRGEIVRHQPSRAVPSPFGPVRLSDYLRTRTFEMVVHGLDVAAALDIEWHPPPEALRDALVLAVGVALETGRGALLLRELTGRDVAETAIPVVR